ncbi:transglutaminase-like domain-containing protein, partial [Vibrio sp. 378]|uniref:SirB1 family protein n=1 Tax=Vibrio sp. 378 TaxID=3074603 RepID=UPI0029641EE2
MLEFFDEDFDNMALVEGALELNKSVNPETNVHWAKQELERLYQEAEATLIHETDEEQRFDSFLRLFFHEWGFKGDDQEYFISDNSFIDKVLERKKGIPVSLGAILLYLGNRLGFPMKGVTFPTQFLIKVDWMHKTPDYINPFNGEYVGEKILQAWLIGQEGPLAQLKPEHFDEADNRTV